MKRGIATIFFSAVLLMAFAIPAGAHNLTVTPPGTGEKHFWVGGGALPANGQGLIPGGPTGEFMLTPAHGGGLTTACGMNGSDVVDIRGPGGPGCPHGQ